MPSEFVFHSKFPVGVANGEAYGNQRNPEIAAFSDGRYVIVWNDESGLGGDSSGSSVKARIFAGDGTPLTADILVNQVTEDHQSVASVAVVGDNDFVVSWTSGDTADFSKPDSQARIFHADGSPAGNEFSISNGPGYQSGAALARLADGGFLAVWTDYGQQYISADDDIKAQRYTFTGVKVGAEFTVNTVTQGGQALPVVAVLKDGRYVVAWTDSSQVSLDPGAFFDPDTGIKAQIFTANGTKLGNEFLVNSPVNGVQGEPTIAALSTGGFVVGWQDYGETTHQARARVYDANSVGGDSFRLGQSPIEAHVMPRLVAWGDGGFLATYSYMRPGNGVAARYFADTGEGQPYEVVVNGDRGNNPSSDYGAAAAILADGSLIFAWQYDTNYVTTGGDGSFFAVMQRGMTLQADIARWGTLIGTYANDRLVGDNGSDTLWGYGADDLLYGGDGPDRIYGGAGNDTIYAGAGNDLIVGGEGGQEVDVMRGGAGDDTYELHNTTSTIIELAGEGKDTVRTDLGGHSLGANLENLTLIGGARDGYGNDAANAIEGNTNANTLFGLGGVDHLFGGAGSDVLLGGTGIDYMYGGAGSDIYWVDENNDATFEDPSDEADTVHTTAVAYALRPNVEHAVMFARSVTLVGNSSFNWVSGNAAANLILSEGGDDTVLGGAGDDLLYGGSGDDYLWGGVGADLLVGGAGADLFYFGSSAEEGATIHDFNRLEGDRIALNGTLFGLAPGPGLPAANFIAGTGMPSSTAAGATILYSTSLGTMFWDPDGTDDAGPIYLATLQGAPSILAGDFYVL